MKKNIMFLATLFMIVSGCSTLKSDVSQVRVDCRPEGALVEINGEHKKSPAEFSVQRNKDVEIICTKPGYLTSKKRVATHLNGTGKLDALGGLLIALPAIGLLTPGAWDLNQTDITIDLVEDPQSDK